MRIIGGTARGTKLAPFDGLPVRPTPDRVREAVFSILFSRIGALNGKRVADLFAGSGAMALEALSRGAASACLVEQDQRVLRLLAMNIKACRMSERTVLIQGRLPDALGQLAGHGPFDLVFLDPPYGQNLVPNVVAALCQTGLLAPSGLIIAETAEEDKLPDTIDHLARIDQRRYGSTTIHLYTAPSLDNEES